MKEQTTKWERLIAGKLAGELAPNEERELAQWMEHAEENRKLYRAYQKLWIAGEDMKWTPLGHDEKEESWSAIQEAIGTDVTRENNRPVILRMPRWSYVAAAAIVVMLLVVFLLPVNPPAEYVRVESGTEIPTEVQLPDGSAVWLNGGSAIRYEKSFENRDVALEGEAFFEVEKDPGSPFTVVAGESRTTVLGTRFNLHVINENEVELLVEEGSVEFTLVEKPSEKLIVEASRGAVARSGVQKVIPLPAFDINRLAWRSGILEFDNAALSRVLMDLEEAYRVEFKTENEALLSCRLNSKFTGTTLDEVISTIEFTLDVEVRRENGIYRIYGEGCE